MVNNSGYPYYFHKTVKIDNTMKLVALMKYFEIVCFNDMLIMSRHNNCDKKH